MADTSTPAKGTEAIPRRAWWALAVASAGYVLVGFNSTATNLAFGSIVESFPDRPQSQVSWTVTAYFIGTAAFLPLGGRLADRYGRKLTFSAGLVGFVVSAVLSAVSPNLWLLIVSRALQAVAGALVIPASLSLVLPEFPESRRGTAVASWAAAGPLSAAIAPSAAAAVLGFANWRVLYFLTAPIAAITLVLAIRSLREGATESSDVRIDIVGAAIGTALLACAVLAVSEGSNWGWTSARLVIVAAIAIVLTPVFLQRCRSHPEPLMNLGLFRIREVWLANLANGLLSVTSLSIWLVWPLFLVDVWGYSTFQVGLSITAGPLGAGPAALIAGRLADRFGHRWLFTTGTLISACGVLWASVFIDPEPNYLLRMFPSIFLFGFGWGLSSPVLNSWALDKVDDKFWGEANATFNTLRNVAAAIGVAAAVAILGSKEGADRLLAFEQVFYLMFTPVLFAFLTLLVLVPLTAPRAGGAGGG